ncbi:Enoyl-CoA hydratase/isomerase [Solidesulfovibrio carbinoliphilus subsp. oakridgensis]|uniref:Enoyl-CoA hydratase/isomerase n=1 Tax=Solidesulfovibrio carbinoliphilus subsp. oakridgensis TaxID=694327 RepID=G7Q7Z1_9BACT|nr:enoyl-CoA hydratase/isomerase family protein [Solidesulfovibrio carbinoliphilus]EHJ47685.1 Enoyl-CoA hydratase/isomerase [Solidesulfovibrio carbinoliphilus subsp. oakridgensis]
MEVATSLVTDNEFFSSERQGQLLIVRGKPHFTRHARDLKKIDTFFDHLEIIAHTDQVNVVVFLGCPEKAGATETMEFFDHFLTSRREDYLIQRLFNLVNNYTVTMAGLDKVTIHADTGHISLFHLNVSLACDYRIVTRNTVFENGFAEVGTIPKGGSGYFLSRMLGAGKTAEILQWPRFTAEEALTLGIVDKIVPGAKLEEEALKIANFYQEPQVSTMLSIRKLLKSDINELRRSLETEDMLILNRVNSPEFKVAMQNRMAARAKGRQAAE